MAEQNLSGNVTGSGQGIVGSATTSIRTVETSAEKLVASLRMAAQLMTQMRNDSATIAKNLSKVVGGGSAAGVDLKSTGGATGAAQAATTAAASGGTWKARMAGTFGGVTGAAVGYGVASMMGNGQGMLGATWKNYANTDATLRMLAPGRFTSTGAATKWLTSGLAAGVSPDDAIAGGSILAGAGFTGVGLTGSNFDVYNQAAKFMQRFTPGASLAQTSAGMASFQNAQFVNFQRARGVNVRDPVTGKTMDPRSIADQMLTNFANAGAGFYNQSKQQRIDAVQQSLMSGGMLQVAMSRSGLDTAGQQQLANMWLADAMAGRPISSMSSKDQTAFLNSKDVSTAFSKADASLSQTIAATQSTTLGATEQSYSELRGWQNDLLKAANTQTTFLKAIAIAQGVTAATGGGALSQALGAILGTKVGTKAVAADAAQAAKGGSAASVALDAAAAATTGAKVLGTAAMVPMLWNATRNWDTSKPSGSGLSGFWNAFKTYATNPIPSAVGGVVRNAPDAAKVVLPAMGAAGAWSDIQGWFKSGSGDVGSRGAPSGAAASPAAGTDTSALVNEAMKWLGTPYSWGGGTLSGPSRGSGSGANTVGFDCSGFVRYVYSKFGVNLPRTTQAMAGSGQEVSKSDARTGDILIITWTGNEPNGHVAIYLGNNQMIHAPHTGATVSTMAVPWGNVSHIRRVISGAAVGDSSVGSGTGTDIAQATGSATSALAFGVKQLWNGTAKIFFGTPKSDALNPTAQSGGGTGGGTGTVLASGNGNAQTVFNTLVSMGFTKQAAAGVIGNLQQESNVNPLSKQDGGGPGRGIMQWTDTDRWAQMVKWATANKKDPNALGTQVSWMVQEMKSYGVWNKLSTMTDVHAATDLFESRMEGAGIPDMGNRYKYADAAYKGFSEGSWRVAKDQIANIHAGEMIVPANVAETLRTSIREGFAGQSKAGGPGQNVYVTINASFAPGTTQQQAMQLVQTFQGAVTKATTATTIRNR